MRVRRALVPVVLLTAAVLSSCGGDDSHDGAEPGGDPSTSTQNESSGTGDAKACDLLSTDDVAAAVGAPVKEGISSSGPAITGGSFDTCVWQSDDPDHLGSMATVTIYPNGDAADSARGEGAEIVEGVGSQAFSVQFSGLWVYVDDRSFFAQWYTLDDVDRDNLPQSKALAQAVVEAL